MDLTTEPVKGRRRYDSSRRRDVARRKRDEVLEAARTLFLRDGYAATTIASVAAAAQVSVETIYKAFGAKPGLVRALQQTALAGSGSVPAPQRSDAMSARETDPVQIMREWATLTMEVMPRTAPIVLLVRSAAATDSDMATVLAEINAERLDRMTHNARRLADRGLLRDGLTAQNAGAVMFALNAPELFESLVLHQHWSIDEFGDFIYRALVAELLDPAAVRRSGVAAPPR